MSQLCRGDYQSEGRMQIVLQIVSKDVPGDLR